MYRGGFEPAPYRLGGGVEEGVNAEQHARLCADVSGMWRTLPLAVMQFTTTGADGSVDVDSYDARYIGDGPSVSRSGNLYTIQWDTSYEDTDGVKYPWFVRHVETSKDSAIGGSIWIEQLPEPNTIQLRVSTTSGITVWVVAYGAWGPDRKISDYGGWLKKRNDEREHPEPYAAQIYRDLQSQRGSAYSKSTGTLVHAENVALSRMWSFAGYRFPEKMVANSLPGTADDAQEYWSSVLGVYPSGTDDEFSLRDKHATHYRAGNRGPTYPNLLEDISELLGDAFVGLAVNHDGQLQNPTDTYWPGVNPGDAKYDLGGGAWYSDRARIVVQVRKPAGISPNEFDQLMNVDLFRLLDRSATIWSVFQWVDVESTMVWNEFHWNDGSEWAGGAFDWNP